jgi:DtxR family Mn-dependent transcriptional regulator
MPLKTTEDYIKQIYMLSQGGRKVSTSALANSLQVADPSITGMLKKLADRGYVRYEPYRGVDLTDEGRRMAMKTVRRHRLWEMFLVTHLGYSWDQVHEEAEGMEHVMSDLLEEKLDALLGYPEVDPHGDPIPTTDGALRARETDALALCDRGETVRIRRVSDRDPLILQHAAQLGLGLNTEMTVEEKRSFDGTFVVVIGGRREFLSRAVAGAIFVERVEA